MRAAETRRKKTERASDEDEEEDGEAAAGAAEGADSGPRQAAAEAEDESSSGQEEAEEEEEESAEAAAPDEPEEAGKEHHAAGQAAGGREKAQSKGDSGEGEEEQEQGQEGAEAAQAGGGHQEAVSDQQVTPAVPATEQPASAEHSKKKKKKKKDKQVGSKPQEHPKEPGTQPKKVIGTSVAGGEAKKRTKPKKNKNPKRAAEAADAMAPAAAGTVAANTGPAGAGTAKAGANGKHDAIMRPASSYDDKEMRNVLTRAFRDVVNEQRGTKESGWMKVPPLRIPTAAPYICVLSACLAGVESCGAMHGYCMPALVLSPPTREALHARTLKQAWQWAALQLFSTAEPPAWWPLDKWQVSTMRRRRSELERVYAAVQAQRRQLLLGLGDRGA